MKLKATIYTDQDTVKAARTCKKRKRQQKFLWLYAVITYCLWNERNGRLLEKIRIQCKWSFIATNTSFLNRLMFLSKNVRNNR